HIVYSWPRIEIEEKTFAGLRHAVHSLHTLGWGIDMAFAQIKVNGDHLAGDGLALWTPALSGKKRLQIPVDGSLDDLQDAHRRFLACVGREGVNPDTRPEVYGLQPYNDGLLNRDCVAFELRTPDDSEAYSKHAEATMVIAAW